jgi:hypothetical protein
MTSGIGPAHTPYKTLLGDLYNQLHPHVRAAHEPLTAEGHVDVAHGTHVLTRFLVRMMNLPVAGTSRPVTLVVDVNSSAHTPTMTWMRQIGTTRLHTQQFARGGRLVERSGPGHIEFALQVGEGGALLYQRTRCRFLGLPLPEAMSPDVRAKVAPTTDGWYVDVSVEWRGQAICRYHGAMSPAIAAP